jgi:hypothetical protein
MAISDHFFQKNPFYMSHYPFFSFFFFFVLFGSPQFKFSPQKKCYKSVYVLQKYIPTHVGVINQVNLTYNTQPSATDFIT